MELREAMCRSVSRHTHRRRAGRPGGARQTQQCDDDRRVKRLIEACGVEEVPRVHHEIDQSEAQERGRRDVAAVMGNGLLG